MEKYRKCVKYLLREVPKRLKKLDRLTDDKTKMAELAFKISY